MSEGLSQWWYVGWVWIEDVFSFLAEQFSPRRILLAGIEAGVWAEFQDHDGNAWMLWQPAEQAHALIAA